MSSNDFLQTGGRKIGAMVHASLSMLNVNSHSLEKWNGVSLVLGLKKRV